VRDIDLVKCIFGLCFLSSSYYHVNLFEVGAMVVNITCFPLEC